MNKLEEQLWDYIDGTCNAVEKAEIDAKLVSDEQFRLLYEELLAVSEQISAHLEIDEPSMSFTRNVMGRVEKEIAPIALKTKVDYRIIYAIGGFFVISLLAIFGYALATAKPNFNIPMPNLDFNFESLFNATALKVFLFVDLVLLLVYFDIFLRKRMVKTQKKED